MKENNKRNKIAWKLEAKVIITGNYNLFDFTENIFILMRCSSRLNK